MSDAAAVDRGRDLVGRDVGGSRDLGVAGVLDRMRREPVAAAGPAVHPAEREHPGVLARAVVLKRRRLGAALELVLGRGRLLEQAANRRELLGRGEVRGGRDRDLLRRQVVADADERQRLERFRRRAQVGDAAVLAGLLDDRAVADGDGMDEMRRLDDAAAPDDDPQCLHDAGP